MADKMDAAAPEHARRLLKDDPSTFTPADVRELQALTEGCVEALGLIRAQTWQLLNALKLPHDTPFVEILKRTRALHGSIADRPTEKLAEELVKRGWEPFSFTPDDGGDERQAIVGPPHGQRDRHEDRVKSVRQMSIDAVVTQAVRRFEAAAPDAKIMAVLTYGIATGVAVERGDVRIEDLRQDDDSTSSG
jgi:hypothetical protein